MFAVILMIGNVVHSYKYPNPMGYICEGHDGIVLSRSSGRKSRTYKLDGERVADIRICYGGMAATPRRAYGAEAFLRSKNWHKDTVESAMLELAKDYQPMNDFRGSAEYRSLASQNLLLRFYLESMGEVGPGGVLDYGN